MVAKSKIMQRKKNENDSIDFLTLKNDFENQNFVIFEKIVDNFGRSYDDMIL